MRRLFLVATLCACALQAVAQQPDIRVHLLTLARVSRITVTPEADTILTWNGTRSRSQVHAQFMVQAKRNVVEAAGRDGSSILLQGRYKIASEGNAAQSVRVPVEISASDGALRIIARFSVEDYVAAVLQGESTGDMPPEALKALAVAIRSYSTRFRERHKSEGFDFCNTTHCQYLRLKTTAAVRTAVERTSGELLWDRGAPLAAYYHKDCGGRTEAASAVWPDQQSPSLKSQRDLYCIRASADWHQEVSRSDIDRALKSGGLLAPNGWDRITIMKRTMSGRVGTLQLSRESQAGVRVSASSFRFALGRALGWNTLKSDRYDVSRNGDRFVFSGRGVGHGVGLCQTGAREMARQGKGYREILGFYFAGAPVSRSAEGIPWKRVRDALFDIRAVSDGDAGAVLIAARSVLQRAQGKTSLTLTTHPTIDVFPTVAMFRDATGEPGWVAASTRDNHIRLEPPSALRDQLEETLHHELLHLLVETNAKAGTPLWFREGLVIYFSGEHVTRPAVLLSPEKIDEIIPSRRSESETKQAYASAASIVRDLAENYGRKRLIEWLRDGLPSSVVASR